MTPLLPHVREPDPREPDVCLYCCEEWTDVDPTEACPLRAMPWTIHADVAELVALVAALEAAPSCEEGRKP